MTPSWWAMIAFTSRSCVYAWRVVGFGCGARCRGLRVLSPWEPMTFMSQRSGRVVGRTAGKGICTSTAGSFGRRRSLLAPALTLTVKVIEVADSVSFTTSCDWAFSSITDSWSASTAAQRRSASWSPFQRVDDLLIAGHISTRLHSSVCIMFFFIVYRLLTFCQTGWKWKDCTHWCKSSSVTWVITLLCEIQAAGRAVSELTLQLDETELRADDCIFTHVWHQNCCSISQIKLRVVSARTTVFLCQHLNLSDRKQW